MERFVNNKRAFPRFPLALGVSVSVDGKVLECHVRDYCAGGMFLLYGRYAQPIAEGKDVGIQFTHPDSPSEVYQLVGKVARSMQHGAGISFTTANQTAMMVLAQLAQKQATEQQQQIKSQIASVLPKVVQQCREIITAGTQKIVDEFLERANDGLFIAAQDSKSNIQQSAFFGGINELQKGKERLGEEILRNISARTNLFDQDGYTPQPLSPEEKAGESDGLSLVDSQEFDDWLVVRSIASKIEGLIPEEMDALETRLSAIAINPITKENNPVGPLVMASVFNYEMGTLILDDAAKKVIFLVMEGVFERELKKIYNELNTVLIDNGVLPDLKKRLEVVKKPSAAPAGSPEASDESPEVYPEQMATEGTPSPSPFSGTASGGGAGFSSAPASYPQRTGSRPMGGQMSGDYQGAVQHASMMASAQSTMAGQQGAAMQEPQIRYNHPASQSEMSPVSAALNVPYREMQELMHLQGGASAPAVASQEHFSREQVMRGLTRLQSAERSALENTGYADYLANALAGMSGGDGKDLSDVDRDSVAYVGGLFTSMYRDNHVPQTTRPWLERMEVPLLKAGVMDPAVLEDAEHPARMVINRLEQVGRHVESDNSSKRDEVRAQVDKLVEAIQQRVEQDPDVFAEALTSLDEIRHDYSVSYRENVNKIVQQCEQESSLNRVRDAILDALNEILGHSEVPKVILRLLDMGLKNLLFRTHVKEGPESEHYRSSLIFIDMLSARLSGRDPVKAPLISSDEMILQKLPVLLSHSCKDKKMNEEMFEEIRSYLQGEAEPAMQYVPALTIKTVHLDAANSRPDGVDVDDWQLILDDVRDLNDGVSFLYEDEEKGKQEVSLVWHDDENKPPRYVFADNSGSKHLDLSLGEVANFFYSNILARMDERNMSVTDRATYDFLQDIHNNISYQAMHDELTGLYNRKSFERKLEESYSLAMASQQNGVLCYVDLDRFNVINATCGHSEGDRLLKNVAEVIQENAGPGSYVARLGGDEFGVIFENAGRVEGLRRTTELHDKIRDIRFGCEENEFNISASIGMAEINDSSDSSGRLLSAVDAACFTAKDQGRDNVQIHNPENERISNRNHILEWVGRINVLFEKNLIQLRCQKIEPVNKTVNSLPHYEVLLDVRDEEGNKVPLDEFIVAAERYNRIIDIDTWVVDNVLNWLEQHREKLNRISGVSINLSGSSIGNRRFMEHIEDRLRTENFPADKVIFEVTETIAINNIDNAARFIRKLKEVGSRFSLDDFGSGTSSYAYLKSLPIDYLKIDGAFVKDIARNAHDYAVVKSINEIGHVMGKKTIAEYVEDEFAYEALKAIGVDYVQGFGVEKPIPLYKVFG